MTIVAAPDGTAITTHTIGKASGISVLMIPGGPCRDVEYLEDFANIGSERPLTVIHPRGTRTTRGLSRGWWNDAEDVIAVADSLGLDTFDLIAHSAGTRLALSVSARFPSRIRSRILITPSASWLTGTPHDGPTLAALRTDSATKTAMASMNGPGPRTEEDFQQARSLQATAGYAAWNQAQQDHSVLGGSSLAATQAWFKDIPADAPEQVLAAPIIPTRVIGGNQDLLSGVQPVRDYAKALDAELILIENCGHYPWVEQPRAFRKAVIDGFKTLE